VTEVKKIENDNDEKNLEKEVNVYKTKRYFYCLTIILYLLFEIDNIYVKHYQQDTIINN
jgi:hypothetical protein